VLRRLLEELGRLLQHVVGVGLLVGGDDVGVRLGLGLGLDFGFGFGFGLGLGLGLGLALAFGFAFGVAFGFVVGFAFGFALGFVTTPTRWMTVPRKDERFSGEPLCG
jgi:hypothetical protein